MEQALEQALPLFLQTAWAAWPFYGKAFCMEAAVVTDIDATVKEVGRKLLKETGSFQNISKPCKTMQNP